MMLEKYPNLREEVGGWNLGCKISFLLDINLPCDQLPLVLWRLACRPSVSKYEKKDVIVIIMYVNISTMLYEHETLNH